MRFGILGAALARLRRLNTLVYTLHCLIVFGVPPLFGWVLLRRVFREANWLVLIPGAVVLGLAALMATVNELRFFWEMRIAVWSAYKLLLVMVLMMIVTLPRPPPRPRLPGCVGRPWKLWLIVAGAVCVGIYFGIPAFGGYLNDAWWFHYPAAVQIQTVERFPLNHVFSLDDPLYYHYGPDVLAACWSFLLEQPVQIAWALNIVILAPCAFLLAFALGTRLARNYWGSLLGAVVLIGGGNLRWLLFFTGKFTGPLGMLRVFNSQTVQGLLQLTFTPSQILGVPLAFAALLLFRHFLARPSWGRGAALGLTLGSITLVAEWYFLPLIAGIGLVLVHRLWRWRAILGRGTGDRAVMALLPLVVAIAWGSFNNTYLAGAFGHFWMRYDSIGEISGTRQIAANLRQPSDQAGSVLEEPIYHPAWQVPNLVPLRFNFAHFGQVPSWESAASNQASFIPIWSPPFLMEIAPVMLCGIPFGFWLAWRRRTPFLLLLAGLATTSTFPPVFLDWGYRSTDFMRFFTASYCYAALFFGWFVGDLWTRAGQRALAIILTVAAVISPIGLGVAGLMPGTLRTVQTVANTAHSLSQVGTSATANDDSSANEAVRQAAFEKLAGLTGDFLFPLTKGRERAIVIVPADQIPETKYFPEWMKMATLSRLLLPVGSHWAASQYSAYYLDAVTKLDARAITSLDAKWVIVSNVFQEQPPEPVSRELADRSRFVLAARFHEGRYSMAIFKIIPR